MVYLIIPLILAGIFYLYYQIAINRADSTTKVERGISNGDEQIILLREIHFWVRACGIAASLFVFLNFLEMFK